jgi:peptide/nickel transport system substrate-binding protein
MANGRTGFLSIGLAILLAACSTAGQPARTAEPSSVEGTVSTVSKRVTAAIWGDPPSLVQELNGFGVRGVDAIEDLSRVGLSITDNQGRLQPRLAEATPSVEAGTWKVLADGTMETTWKIRERAAWHDGTPLTASDLVFALTVGRDREVPEFGHAGFAFIDDVEATDARTLTVRWKQAYVDADKLFSSRFAAPLPKHLLEAAYLENKAGFAQLPYWSDAFVGTGPFKVREFSLGSHVLFEAFDGYALGRPKIDVVELRFVPEVTTIAANILAGGVDVTLGKTLSVEQAIEVRDQWRTGGMDNASHNPVSIFPQFLNPNPALVANLQFRRALLHAVDRQELADTLMAGLTPVAHSFLFPNQAQYREIEAALPRYEHDPRRAGQMVEALGYAKGADGLFRDAGGQQLAVELRTYTGDVNQKATLAVADGWQRAGVKVDVNVMSPQATRDNEYVFTYPGFTLQRYTGDLSGLPNLYSHRAPTPQTNFRSGNVSRYQNPEFDALLDRYFTTVPMQPRTQVLGQIIYHIADQLTQMTLFYDAEPTMISKRLANVTSRWPSSTQAWNSHQWDLK